MSAPFRLGGRPVAAIAFDYGNTLIEFSQRQLDRCDEGMADALDALYGPTDRARLRELRDVDRMAPYRDGLRENDLTDITTRLVMSLHGRRPSDAELAELMDARVASFVAAVQVEAEVLDLLRALAQRVPLAVASNYPCGRSIRESLRRTGIDEHLRLTVVSGEVGFVKPHPAMFDAVTAGLGVPAADTLFVGDNWLADVQGAGRAGMAVAHVRRWAPPERFEPSPGDRQPDVVLGAVQELAALLG